MNEGIVYAVYTYDAESNDELTFHEGDSMMVLRKGDEVEKEWWWSRREGRQDDQAEGYIPRNLLGLYPRVPPPTKGAQPMEE
jgi:apoptosis-stimulating of p53 protein 1